MIAASVLAGCSSVPDELNPVVWAEAVDDLVTGEDGDPDPEFQERVDAERARPVPGADEPFPNLDTVPDRAPDITSYEERRAIADSLIADRTNSRYSDQIVDSSQTVGAVATGRSAGPRPEFERQEPIETLSDAVPPTRRIAGVSPGRAVYDDRSAVEPTREYRLPTRSAGANRQVAAAPPAPLPASTPQQAAAPRTPISVEQEVYRMFVTSGGLSTELPASPVGMARDYRNQVPVAAAPGVRSPGAGVASAVSGGGGAGGAARAGLTANAVQPTGSYHAAVIYYGHGSARLSEKDRQILRQVAEAHREYGGRVRIIGHASSRTKTSDVLDHKLANYTISQRRAGVVADTLKGYGVPRDDLIVEALADSAPGFSEATPQGEAANRRTDVFLEFSS